MLSRADNSSRSKLKRALLEGAGSGGGGGPDDVPMRNVNGDPRGAPSVDMPGMAPPDGGHDQPKYFSTVSRWTMLAMALFTLPRRGDCGCLATARRLMALVVISFLLSNLIVLAVEETSYVREVAPSTRSTGARCAATLPPVPPRFATSTHCLAPSARCPLRPWHAWHHAPPPCPCLALGAHTRHTLPPTGCAGLFKRTRASTAGCSA